MSTADESVNTRAGMPPIWWSVGAMAFIMLIFIVTIAGVEPPSMGKGTSYDASPEGFRGAYVILDELKYPVTRSRRPAGEHVLWVLSPEKVDDRDVRPVLDWVSRGGRMLLSDPSGKMAAHVVPGAQAEKLGESKPIHCDVDGVGTLQPGLNVTKLSSEPQNKYKVCAKADDEPLVSIHRHGSGEVWLLHRPDLIRNHNVFQADNSVFVCRLAEAMLANGPDTLAFDEYLHGLRDRPSVLELLWQRPMRWITLHALALAGIIIWRHGVRFGALRLSPPPSRRSKEEFLDALTDLYRRQGDLDSAFRLVQHDLVHRLAEQMGLPGTADGDLVAAELVRRRGATLSQLIPVLSSPTPPGGRNHFLDALRQLEHIRHEFLRS